MTVIKSIRPEERKVPCPECYGSGYTFELVEVTFDEFEEVPGKCFFCCGTGRKMSREERNAIRRRS